MYLLLYLVTAHGLDRHSRQHQLTRPSPTASIDARLLRQIRNSAARTRKPGETVWDFGYPVNPAPPVISSDPRAPVYSAILLVLPPLSLSLCLPQLGERARPFHIRRDSDRLSSQGSVPFPTIVRFRSKLPP